MADEDDENIISEAAEYSPKSEFSKPAVVQEAVSKCIENRSQEMKAGYFNESADKNGNKVKTWIKDTRKIFISSVEALRHLLYPECSRDTKYMKQEKTYLEKAKEIKETYSYEEWKIKETQGRCKYEKTGRKYMPEIDDTLPLPVVKKSQTYIERIPGGWNTYINLYYDELIHIYDKLFAELNYVIDRLNYFKQKISF